MDINGNQVEKFGCSISIYHLPLEILLPMVEKYLKNPEELRTMTMAMTMNHAGKLLVPKVFQLHRHLHNAPAPACTRTHFPAPAHVHAQKSELAINR